MTPFVDDTDFTLYVGDALETLRGLPDESVHCCVTSPPYWGLRDYGTGSWEGGDEGCDHKTRARGDMSADVDRKGHAPGSNFANYQAGYESGDAFKDACGKCGARRVDNQLGLEPTPEEYVANMVAVFREVRRVLRRDGTCWLNIGDSYNNRAKTRETSHQPALNNFVDDNWADRAARGGVRMSITDGQIKEKDLVGIPWRLAFALQQPYYTGTIKDERDRIWLAAMVEAEGCMFLHKRGVGQYASSFTKQDGTESHYHRKNATYGAGLEVASTDRAIVERCLEIAGKGSIGEQTRGRKRTLYRWMLRSNECRDIIRELYPHFVAKHHEARLLIGCPSSGDKAEAAWSGLKEIHGGGVPAVDFAAPESLLDPGWYVRSDIVWSKLNPMPESVTDRPTKAHEYLFLLTRSARYFYDADAIREEWSDNSHGGGTIGARYRELRGPYANYVPQGAPKDKPQESTLDGSNGESPRGPDGRRSTHVKKANGSIQHRDGERWPNGGRNRRSVWEIATEPYPDAHFATFPQALVEPCVLAGTSERGCCPECGAPWERETERTAMVVRPAPKRAAWQASGDDHARTAVGGTVEVAATSVTTGWLPTCKHGHEPIGCSVLDPFLGSGTSALVARRLGRRTIGIELSADYAQLAAKRLQQLSLLAAS